MRRLDLYSYTVKDGELLRTRNQARGKLCTRRLRGDASFRLGDHPIADELRSLDLRETAIERLYAPEVQSMLHPASARLPLQLLP